MFIKSLRVDVVVVWFSNYVIGLCLNSGDTNTSKKLKVDENSKYIITLVDSRLDVN